jgi:hypothetical protein
MAPEVLEINEMTKAGDVYSFAILLLELWSGVVAYPDENYFRVRSLAKHTSTHHRERDTACLYMLSICFV